MIVHGKNFEKYEVKQSIIYIRKNLGVLHYQKQVNIHFSFFQGITFFSRHHRLNGHEFEQTLGADDGQGSLECCSPSGGKESDMTE